jgi:nucleotide-binding universal stress UspA family protein
MYQKILVAVDTSEMSKTVFTQALFLAQMSQANLMILHVLSAEEENSPLPIPPDLSEIYPAAGNDLTLEIWREQWDNFEKEGLNLLGSYTEKAKDAGVSAEANQISGSPGRRICKFAKTWKADLIVVGHRGRTGLSEIILGSVSNYVLHHAPCSVLIVQTPSIVDS